MYFISIKERVMESNLEKSIKTLTDLGLINLNIEKELEAAYIKQLKKEAFKLYGEIKDGDKFQFYGKGFHSIKLSDTPELDYFKEFDELSLWGFPLYKQGKWAKKQEERVEVRYDSVSVGSNGYRYEFINSRFKITNHVKVGEFLAEQLQKYLNNEINE